MKYQSSNTKLVYEIDFQSGSRGGMYVCPECSPTRKKTNDRALKFYHDTGRAYCHHCTTTFFEYKPYEKNKNYVLPKWENKTKLTDHSVKWFTGRMISQDTLVKMKVYSDRVNMPQFRDEKEIEVICFPYFIDEKLINIKYRGKFKSFKLVSGAELIWYNFNALKSNKEIIICEGEMDLLTWVENGFDNVISTPNGANDKTLDYLDSSIELFDNIEIIYLSTDNDSAGIKWRDELIRRLGAEKCRLIDFKQHKDANDYFIHESGLEFKKLLKNSKEVPITGIVKPSDIKSSILELYEHGEQSGLKINDKLDNLVTWELGRLLTVTGVPGSGKSEWVDFLVTKLNLVHGWKAAYFTPENYPLEYHYRKIHSKISGKKFEKNGDSSNFDSIFEHINSNFEWILDEENFTVDFVLERAKYSVKKNGTKIIVIDPYNKLEHQYPSSQTETQYISKFLDKLSKFAQFNRVLMILIAHPRKMEAGKVPSLYDINGSANFYNKTDYGITTDRPRNTETGAMGNQADIYIQKIKYKHLGEQGLLETKYNYNNGRFEDIDSTVDFWDNSNWLFPEERPTINELYEGIEPPEEYTGLEPMPF